MGNGELLNVLWSIATQGFAFSVIKRALRSKVGDFYVGLSHAKFAILAHVPGSVNLDGVRVKFDDWTAKAAQLPGLVYGHADDARGWFPVVRQSRGRFRNETLRFGLWVFGFQCFDGVEFLSLEHEFGQFFVCPVLNDMAVDADMFLEYEHRLSRLVSERVSGWHG